MLKITAIVLFTVICLVSGYLPGGSRTNNARCDLLEEKLDAQMESFTSWWIATHLKRSNYAMFTHLL